LSSVAPGRSRPCPSSVLHRIFTIARWGTSPGRQPGRTREPKGGGLAATPPRRCMARERVNVVGRDRGPAKLSPRPLTNHPYVSGKSTQGHLQTTREARSTPWPPGDSLTRRDGVHQIRPENHHQDAFNKETTPGGDVVPDSGQSQAQLSPGSIQIRKSGRRREDIEKTRQRTPPHPQPRTHSDLVATRYTHRQNARAGRQGPARPGTRRPRR